MKIAWRNQLRVRARLCAILVCALTGGLFSASCSQKTPTAEAVEQAVSSSAESDVARFVLDKMTRYKVVMLADHGHNRAEYILTAAAVLGRWADSVTSGTADVSVPRTVVLVLEIDSLEAQAVQQYALSGDVQHVLSVGLICTERFFTAKLEFYSRIGEILHRIADFNRTVPDSTQWVQLVVTGPELPIDEHSWSRKQGNEWFLTKRDSYITDRICENVARYPNAHALVFYGSAHLMKSKMLKQTGKEEKEGYYLAHYLSERFPGDSGVYTVGQPRLEDWHVMWGIIESVPRPFALDHHALASLNWSSQDLELYDGSINLPDISELPWPLYRVPSERLVRLILDSMPTILDIHNDFSAYRWPVIISYLETTTGTLGGRVDIRDSLALCGAITYWRSKVADLNLDIPVAIANLTYWTRLIDRFEALDPRTDGIMVRRCEELLDSALINEPMWEQTAEGKSSKPDRVNEHRKYLADNRKWLVTGLLVNLLWVGTSAECDRAKLLLAAETGKNFQTPLEWMDWWRNETKTEGN